MVYVNSLSLFLSLIHTQITIKKIERIFKKCSKNPVYGGANLSSKRGRLRQVNQEFKANLGYIKNNHKKKS